MDKGTGEKKVEHFFIEVKNNQPLERISKFLEEKLVKVIDFKLEHKTEKTVSYKVNYIYNPDMILALETIKKEHLSEKENFKITKLVLDYDFLEIVNKKIEEIKQAKVIKYTIDYSENVNLNFIKQVGAVGLEFINEEEMKKQRNILGYMIKTVGSNLFHGKSIMNVSLPINVSDYRSNTEVIAYAARLNEFFFKRAQESSNIEKLKLITASFIGGLHFNLAAGKPFNPILGETFQTQVGSTKCYIEQTSHHPPVTNYLFMNDLGMSYGNLGMEASMSGNQLEMAFVGKSFMKTNDGGFYQIHFPSFFVKGIMFERRYMNFSGSLTIEDHTNGLIAYIRFNPDDRGFFSKMFSKDTYPDFISGFIASKSDVKVDPKTGIKSCDKKLIYANIAGEWTRFINFNDVCYWRQDEQELTDMERMDFTLPSDASYRHDLVLYRMGLNEKAQEAKYFLEEQQRKDMALMKVAREKK